jgi:plastocyanin
VSTKSTQQPTAYLQADIMNKFAIAIAASTTLIFTQACSQLANSTETQAAPTPVASSNPHEGHVMNESQDIQKLEKPLANQITLATPGKIAANTPVALEIDVQDKQGKAIAKFDIFQEKLMHLIVVSDDLQFFDHLHPDYKGNGKFEVTANFPAAGNYTIFSDYKPTGQKEQVSIAKTTVTGATPTISNIDFLGRTKTVDRTKVALSISESKLQVGQEVTFTFNLTDANSDRPIQDLQPYLGERGHLVILRQSPTLSKADYIHAHALKNTPTGQVSFMTAFPQAGKYKLWGQFNRGGKIEIADFWVDVRDERSPVSNPPQPHH